MEDYYESNIRTLSDSEIENPRGQRARNKKPVQRAKLTKKKDQDIKSRGCNECGEKTTSSTSKKYTYHVKQDNIEYSTATETPNVIPYAANDSFCKLKVGSLAFVSVDNDARKIYKTPEIGNIEVFNGTRYIACSKSQITIGGVVRRHFHLIRTQRTISSNLNVIVERISADQNGTKVDYTINIMNVEPSLVGNFAISGTETNTYLTNSKNLWAINRGGAVFLNVQLPPMDQNAVRIVSGRLSSCYTGGVVNQNVDYRGVKLERGTGFLMRLTVSRVISQLVQIKADDLSLRGMYYRNEMVYVTGTYSGQLALISRVPENGTVKKIAGKTRKRLGFILALDESLNFMWWRLIGSDCPDSLIMGDVTVNFDNQLITTVRYVKDIAISEVNCVDTESCDNSCDEGIAVISLTRSNDRISQRLKWIIFQAGLSPNNTDYISLDNFSKTFVMSGFTDVTFNNNLPAANHQFVVGLDNKLNVLYYNQITTSRNIVTSRNVAVNDQNILIGGSFSNELFVAPFGMVGRASVISGFYATLALTFPKLIGVVVSRTDCEAALQFSGLTNALEHVRVGRDYFIDNVGELTSVNYNNRYYGTGVKDGVLKIS
jgi:hypothetical protein